MQTLALLLSMCVVMVAILSQSACFIILCDPLLYAVPEISTRQLACHEMKRRLRGQNPTLSISHEPSQRTRILKLRS